MKVHYPRLQLLAGEAQGFPAHSGVDRCCRIFLSGDFWFACSFFNSVLQTHFRQQERTGWQWGEEDRAATRSQLLSGTPASRPCPERPLSPPEQRRKSSSPIHSCDKATGTQGVWNDGLSTRKPTLPRAAARIAQGVCQLQIRSLKHIVIWWRMLRDRRVILNPNTLLQVQNPAVFIVNLHVHRSYPWASVCAGWEASEEKRCI